MRTGALLLGWITYELDRPACILKENVGFGLAKEMNLQRL